MCDMLPRKPSTSVTDIKKSLKDSLFSNGMNQPSTSPALRSPTTSGGSNSPTQDGGNKGMNYKSRSDSPHVLKNSDEKNYNLSSNCISTMMSNSVTPPITIATTASSIVTSPISSPGIMPVTRTKSSPHSKLNKQRRNHSTEPKSRNKVFDFDLPEDQSSSDNFCNNNNNSKHREKSPFNLRHACMKSDEPPHASRTPSTNSTSDLSPSSLTTTEERTAIETPSGQNIDDLAIDNTILDINSPMCVDDNAIVEALEHIADDLNPTDSAHALSDLVGTFPDAGDDLGLDKVTNCSSLNYSEEFSTTPEAFLFGNSSQGEPTLGGNREQSPVSVSSATVTTATCAVTQAMHNILTSPASSLVTSVSSPTFHPDSSVATSSFHPKFSPPEGAPVTNQGGKSHLQDILGVTDTIRLKNMSRSIDSVPYKSPTTTSYSSHIKPHTTPHIPTSPCSMAPPLQHRLPSNLPFKAQRPPFMYNEGQMFRQNLRGPHPPFMEVGMNNPWNRGSPSGLRSSPGQLRSPTFPQTYVETSASPTNINPMSGLQSTVDSIPAAPTSGPNTPVGGSMGPPLMSPLGFDGTPPPGGRMRPPPSPSISSNDKRCVSADAVNTPTSTGKKGNKRERTRSADSKEEDKKETSGPKNKRRKSRSKEDNSSGKKGERNLTRSVSSKGESSGPRLNNSALSKMLNPDAPSSNPYVYIFNTEIANNAAKSVTCKQVPNIIVFHQSFVGNQPLGHPTKAPPTKPAPPSVQMPTMSRSPTEIKAEYGAQKTPPPDNVTSFPEPVHDINLQDTKPPMIMTSNNVLTSNPEVFTSQSEPNPKSFNGEQNLQATEELSAEKRRTREDKLGKLRKLEQLYLKEPVIDVNNGQRGPGWPGPGMNYGMPPQMEKGRLKEGMMTSEGPMMGGQGMTPEHATAEWYNLIQEYNAEKMQKQQGLPPDVPSRPPPPYRLNGPQHRWVNPDGYHMERMPMPMDPRFQRMVAPNHRPLTRMPQDPRFQGNYNPHRLVGPPRASYPPVPNTRMPMYEPYISQQGMMVPGGVRPPSMGSRLPPPGMRQPGVNENYPFSEQLMKQASFYNRETPFDPDPSMMPDWQGPDGTQRLSHMSGSTSPNMGVQVMGGMVPMDMESRLTPVEMRMNSRGYEMGPYPPDMQRYDMLPGTLGSPTTPMDVRMPQYCANAGGSMMDAMARRGEPRPPDLNLNSQMHPRSPMNYHVRGPQPSPSVMTSMGPRYPTPVDMAHPPQPSPMHGGPRSPLQSPSMGPYGPIMGPASAGIDQPQIMIGGGPHSAGPMSNPPVDWSGPSSNIPGPHTPSSIHHMMTSQQGMTSQSMMMSQPGMMPAHGMMSPQQQHMIRMTSSGGKPAPSTLSTLMNQMNKFKMPEQSPLYQEAVKDTASPPPLNHNEPPPLTHSTMPGGMRMQGPQHPPTYDSRIGPPRGPHMNEGFQGYLARHPSPLQGQMPGNMMMGGNMPTQDSMLPPSGYNSRPIYDGRGVPEFDLRGILPSEKPSQTISYLPPETNEPYSAPPTWGGEGIRPQQMQAPMYPSGPNSNRPLI